MEIKDIINIEIKEGRKWRGKYVGEQNIQPKVWGQQTAIKKYLRNF